MVQPFFAELEHPEFHHIISIGDGRFAEERFSQDDLIGRQVYDQATRSHLLGQDTGYAALWRPWAGRAFSSLDSPPNRQVIGELAEGCITYSEETEEALDFIGPFNGFVYDGLHHDTADFKLVDTLWPNDVPLIAETAQVLPLLNDDIVPTLSRYEKAVLLNGTNYIRLVNYMGRISVIGSRLEPFDPAIEWREDITQRIYEANKVFLQETRSDQGPPSLYLA